MERIVMIPALNPDEKLRELTERLRRQGNRVIVVDDGSGEAYSGLFQELKGQCIVLCHKENRGKGAAIKTGLRYVRTELGGRGVIGLMDADGQHLPEDMERLLLAAEKHPAGLILGSRSVDGKMPWKSRAGNLITRGIFRMITGMRVTDTQSGLRAFSADLLDFMEETEGNRYEYEMNVLMKCARQKIPVIEVPIQTVYHDRKNSCSHFRKVRDSVRIYGQLLRFSLASFSSFVLDYGLFLLFAAALSRTARGILAANIGARILSGTYNYMVNCRLMSGSFVISGRACARAVRVGSESYAARLAAEVKKEKRVQSELLGSMRKVTRITSLLIIPLGIVLFLEALFLRNAPVNEAVVSSAAALLGMLPKGLVLLISVSLAAGVIRLARMKILVQNIYSLETLAHVDTLCLDKTGTLTDGNLKVHSVIPMTTFPQGEADLLVRSYMAACEDNNATFQALPAGIQPLYGVVLEDAIRPHVKETLEFFRKEGVDVKIISGDHVTTVSQIARRAGLDRWGEAIDLSAAGKDLDYDMLCRKYSVFARVTPGQVPADGALPRGAFRADSHGHDHPAQSAGSFFRGAEADGHVYSADPDFHGGGGEKLCALQPAQNLCLRHHGPGNLRGALPPALPV